MISIAIRFLFKCRLEPIGIRVNDQSICVHIRRDVELSFQLFIMHTAFPNRLVIWPAFATACVAMTTTCGNIQYTHSCCQYSTKKTYPRFSTFFLTILVWFGSQMRAPARTHTYRHKTFIFMQLWEHCSAQLYDCSMNHMRCHAFLNGLSHSGYLIKWNVLRLSFHSICSFTKDSLKLNSVCVCEYVREMNRILVSEW